MKNKKYIVNNGFWCGFVILANRGLWLFFICLLLASCSGTRHLPEGEKLYTGAEIDLQTADDVDEKQIVSAAKAVVRPDPNDHFWGMRPKLILYQAAGENPTGRFKKWLKKRGELPVLISQLKPGITADIIDARLFNMGIFNSNTEFRIVEKKRTAKVIYTSCIHKPYVFSELQYDFSSQNPEKENLNSNSIRSDYKKIEEIILLGKDKSFVKAGENYSLQTLENERVRIDALLKDRGYFYFNPDYLLFKADTFDVDAGISLKLTLKPDLPRNALKPYYIRNVFINQDYSLNADSSTHSNDTTIYRNVVFVGAEEQMNIKPDVILRSVYLRKNEVYTRENHSITLNRLMSMGNFKFVQLKFSESDTLASGFMDVSILMTPMPNYRFRAEMDIVTKSNSYTGPRMNLSIQSRNAFKGAELLNLNLAGSFEAQLSAASKNLFSYSWNPELELTFPRFWAPFPIKSGQSMYVPKTNLSFSYNYMKRVDYFDMRIFRFAYGYKWKNNIRDEHNFNPINVSNSAVFNESDKFTALLASNPFLKKSYEEQFIGGGSYSYTYNEQFIQGKSLQFYFNGAAETAGNLFSLAKIITGDRPTADNPSTMLGSVYSQFVKVSLDGRAYYHLRDNNKLALRLFAGVAKSYGNSSTLPYSKQFFSGGPNSIRAFQINSLGPGNYFQNTENVGFLQLGGDIKLEMNAEYRFDIYRFLKGALFLDAGNVWQQASNPSNIGTPFAFNGFMNEIAVGAGFGLRVDVSFFVLRFDLATPLRKPWLTESNRWVISDINPLTSAWRNENMMLNIAIGYPF
ncbi:MAG: BamA/TamA family outer membrane protein [Paludibacteraceae bacterium]|nr:BamA/TamA family outer membrane protein [Paludibacteraceae bacterium]